MKFLRLLCLLCSCAGGAACRSGAPSEETDAGRAATDDEGRGADAAVGQQRPAEVVRPGFCDRRPADAVGDLFCGEVPPQIGSLRELQQLLEVDPSPFDQVRSQDAGAAGYGYGANAIVVLAHSTALSGHRVSPINPRALLLGRKTIMAFQRGVQQLELASRARDADRFNFYLLSFEQACSEQAGGCSPGDLYTPRVEADWTRVVIQDDEELKNTASDCRQCHQRARAQPILLMRELEGPWTHFFFPDNDNAPAYSLPEPGGRDLVHDYLRAKGDEPYGGIPKSQIRQTVGLGLEGLMPLPQPLVFDGEAILKERWPRDPNDPDGWPDVPQRSATWDRAYEAFQRGEQLALPHFEPRPTDPAKQARLTEAYQQYLAGEITADELPDLTDIFPDDPRVRAEIGLQNVPAAAPAEALVQTCGSCHNDVLDQTISRARFNIALARMDAAERELAIERLERPADAPGAMPPEGARQLDPDARTRLIDYLRQAQRPAADDAFLEHAAVSGMAGPLLASPTVPSDY